jgi:hypothetical protein
MPMKALRPWLFLKIYLFVIGAVGCIALSFLTAVSCGMGGGCNGNEFLSAVAEIIIGAWPFMLLLLMPVVMLGGYAYTVRAEEKDKK